MRLDAQEPEASAAGAGVASEGASHRRWAVLAFLIGITVINFIDRQTLSVLAPKIREMLHLSHGAYGRIVAPRFLYVCTLEGLAFLGVDHKLTTGYCLPPSLDTLADNDSRRPLMCSDFT